MGRRANMPATEDVDEESDVVVLSVKLKSGRFISELQVPVSAASADQKKAVLDWLDFIQTGFRIGATSMDAVLDAARPQPGDRNDGE